MDERTQIEQLRRDAATALLTNCPEQHERARGYLRMVEVLKVKLLAKGDRNIVVTSSNGTNYRRVK